jgi:outer membrane protein OmpA-like peptidoglycan-associated protein
VIGLASTERIGLSPIRRTPNPGERSLAAWIALLTRRLGTLTRDQQERCDGSNKQRLIVPLLQLKHSMKGNHMKKLAFLVALLCWCEVLGFAQDQAQSQPGVININISVSRTAQAVSYPINTSSSIDFVGTPFLPFAKGQAKVENKKGVITIQAELQKMSQASTLGPEFLTYVLWAITPEGRARNLGEFQLNGDKSKLTVTTQLPNFAMIVTAEPYFAVSYASEEVVLQGNPGSDTKGQITPVVAQLLSRSTYHESQLQPFTIDPKVPLIVYQARNALRIAQLQGAEKYAANAWASAQQAQTQMEDYLARKQKNPILTAARSATQQAEDARSIAVKQEGEEKVAEAKRAEAERVAAAAQREAQLKADQTAEAQRSAEAEALAAKEAQARAEADAARKQADEAAQKSAQKAAQAVEAQRQLRAQLLAQLNAVLQTVDTPRGLVVTMADILFASGKYELSQNANLALAKLSGVILAHPGLNLKIGGYTDSTGGDQINLKLSGQRADAVRMFLVQQGLNPETVTSMGMGSADPVASNDSSVGRQQNRRVEIVVSGETIGSQSGT